MRGREAVGNNRYQLPKGTKMRLDVVLVIILILVFLSGCRPSDGTSDSLKDEAYDSGWDSAYNERCHKTEPPLMIPSQFDDSTSDGELVSYYRSGYAEAHADPDLCKQ